MRKAASKDSDSLSLILTWSFKFYLTLQKFTIQMNTKFLWWAREDLNLQALRHMHLKHARIPIPPLARTAVNCTLLKSSEARTDYQSKIRIVYENQAWRI